MYRELWTAFHYTLKVKTAKNRNKDCAKKTNEFSPSKSESNPICHLLALLAGHHILHVRRIKANLRNGNRALDKVNKWGLVN